MGGRTCTDRRTARHAMPGIERSIEHSKERSIEHSSGGAVRTGPPPGTDASAPRNTATPRRARRRRRCDERCGSNPTRCRAARWLHKRSVHRRFHRRFHRTFHRTFHPTSCRGPRSCFRAARARFDGASNGSFPKSPRKFFGQACRRYGGVERFFSFLVFFGGGAGGHASSKSRWP